MFIPVALGLLGSDGKDIPLSSVYHDGMLESISNSGQPAHTTVLRVTKVSRNRTNYKTLIEYVFIRYVSKLLRMILMMFGIVLSNSIKASGLTSVFTLQHIRIIIASFNI